LKYALTRKESQKIVRDREGMIKIDGKVRRDPRFPLGMMDVVTIEKTNENFRILLDTKGRFLPHRIDQKEAGFKLCKVLRKRIGKEKVPHIVTHDGRTIRYPHPDVQINDSLMYNFSTGEIQSIIKFQNNAIVMITGGNNIGRIGHLQSMEKHPGSFEIAHIRDATGTIFATRLGNVMVVGDSKESVISLPKGEGIRLSLIEERAKRLGNEEEEEDDEEDEN
jgi:small subunit ribosomal protein S4e